jgi:hypothetical protein
METKQEEIILFTDEKAAKLVTLTGWLSNKGHFFGNGKEAENFARYDGCTHKLCDCGRIMTKGYTKCDDCRTKSRIEAYNALPFQEWDGKTLLAEWDGDQYFSDIGDIEDFCIENDLTQEDLRLVICVPCRLSEIYYDYWNSVWPEDMDEPPAELQKHVEVLNKYIRNAPPVSWAPGRIRTSVKFQIE